MTRWISSKYGDLMPALAFLVTIGGVYVYDHDRAERPIEARRVAELEHGRVAALLANQIGTAVNERLAAMNAGELQFTPLEASVSQRAFAAAIDTVNAKYEGLAGLAIIQPDGTIIRGPGAVLGLRGADPRSNQEIGETFRRARRTGGLAASGVVSLAQGRRVFVIRPVQRSPSTDVMGYLAGELDPGIVVMAAHSVVQASVGDVLWSVIGPQGERITTGPARAGWSTVDRAVRVGDTQWHVRVAYEPLNMAQFHRQRIVTWVIGVLVALALSSILLLFRRTIAWQDDEIGRRQIAEAAAHASASEARELTAQLESAHRASQRLSTSLNPDDVVEFFLGGVAEILKADVASLYTFEEEGEVLVGRRRIVFRDVDPGSDGLKHEDIRHVRAPIALLPTIGEAVATGEPHVKVGREPMLAAVAESPASTVTIPLLIAGHMVGVATWETYDSPVQAGPEAMAFAQAMAAPAAAALRTAELFTSLVDERARARREMLRFAAVLDQMADGVVVVDASGRVERYNKAAQELLGTVIEAVALEDWSNTFNLVTSEGRPLAPEELPLLRALQGSRIRRATLIVRLPLAGERHLSCSAAPITTADGNITGAAMVLRDVSDEHQYAEMLRHTNRELRLQADVLEQVNQRLREATRAKDQFLAVMSHELRTPINAIMGYSDLLDLGVKGDLNTEQLSMVTRVRETSRHLLGLINEVLDLAKIGAGRMELVLVEVDLPPIIERAVQQLQPMAVAKGLSLNVSVLPGSDGNARVLSDETRLTQIVINLLSNAVKFTRSGEVSVRYGATEDTVEMRVRDTGPGIAEEQRERIFEEFYQVDSTLSRASGGTGLGLAIARRIAHLLGGEIRVESEVGAGSEFILTLPTAQRAGQQRGADRLPVVAYLANSEAALVELSSALDGTVRVLGTTDPVQLTAFASTESPDCVVLDASAPDSGAWRALGELQSDKRSAGVRVALIARDGETPNALDFGTFHTLPGFLSPDQSAEQIRSLLADRGVGLILLGVADSQAARLLADALENVGQDVLLAGDSRSALRIIREARPAAAVLDLLLPGPALGLGMVARLNASHLHPTTPVIVRLDAEFTSEQLLQLEDAVRSAALSGEAHLYPISQLVQDAVSEPIAAHPSLA
jgi:PAS domain S-box-containing protein